MVDGILVDGLGQSLLELDTPMLVAPPGEDPVNAEVLLRTRTRPTGPRAISSNMVHGGPLTGFIGSTDCGTTPSRRGER